MGDYRLSSLAKQDIRDIAAYTLERWGDRQAARYLDGFEDICQLLAERPQAGVAAEYLAPGLRSYGYHAHLIFYEPREGGVHVLRVLHAAMDPTLHELEGPDDEE